MHLIVEQAFSCTKLSSTNILHTSFVYIGKIEEYNSSSLHPPISTHYFVDQDGGDFFFVEETIHVPASLNSSTLLDTSRRQWFHNGQSVSSDGTKYNTSFLAEEGVIRVVLMIRNITDDDSGLYTIQLSTDIISFLFDHLVTSCSGGHDYYFFFYYDVRLRQTSVGMVTFKVEEYSKYLNLHYF